MSDTFWGCYVYCGFRFIFNFNWILRVEVVYNFCDTNWYFFSLYVSPNSFHVEYSFCYRSSFSGTLFFSILICVSKLSFVRLVNSSIVVLWSVISLKFCGFVFLPFLNECLVVLLYQTLRICPVINILLNITISFLTSRVPSYSLNFFRISPISAIKNILFRGNSDPSGLSFSSTS